MVEIDWNIGSTEDIEIFRSMPLKIAGVSDIDTLAMLKEEMEKAFTDGITFAKFRNNVKQRGFVPLNVMQFSKDFNNAINKVYCTRNLKSISEVKDFVDAKEYASMKQYDEDNLRRILDEENSFPWDTFETGNRLRIILESAKYVRNTDSYDTLIRHINIILDSIEKLSSVWTNKEIVEYYQTLHQQHNGTYHNLKAIKASILSKRNDTICPYCGFTFDVAPSRKRACPKCKQQIIRFRNWSEDDKVYLMTQEEYKLYDTLYIINPARDIPIIETKFIDEFCVVWSTYNDYFLPDYEH